MVGAPTIDQVSGWSDQQVFDHIAWHMLKQGERCTRGNSRECVYRDGEGRACAVGAIIPDEVYDPAMEQRGICDLMALLSMPRFQGPQHQAFGEVLRAHGVMLLYLLRAHDQVSPVNWPIELRNIAATLELHAGVVDLYATTEISDVFA